jgi:hypothetical protein
MKRITISLPEDIAELLADDARRKHRSVSELAREAIAIHLGVSEACEPRILPFVGLFASGGKGDFDSSTADEYLAKHWPKYLADEMADMARDKQ